MTVRVYSNSDAGAPPLRGNTAGDVIAVLKACLVDGYGGKAPAGWSQPYVAGNICVFRQGGGEGKYLRVDDTSTTLNYRSARVVAYEQMSDVNTGTNAFPTEATMPGGYYWGIQYATSGTPGNARRWMVVADETAFYFFGDTQATGATGENYGFCYFFGDLTIYAPADDFATLLTGNTSATAVSVSSIESAWTIVSSPTSGNSASRALARRYDGLGASIVGGLVPESGFFTGTTGIGTGSIAYPNRSDGKLVTARALITENSTGDFLIRAEMPGVFVSMHPFVAGVQRYDTFEGSGDLAGRSFVCYRMGSSGLFIETSDTWRM